MLKKELEKRVVGRGEASLFKPKIFKIESEGDYRELEVLLKSEKVEHVVDYYAEMRNELEEIRNPSEPVPHNHLGRMEVREEFIDSGHWVYYPWRSTLVHVPEESVYEEIRTSRDHTLISREEEIRFRESRVGIAGLNVGNPAAICMALENGPKECKYADNDILALSNLNRFRAGLCDLGINKAVLSARQTYEIDPYARVEVFENGITPGETEKFLLNPKLDVLVEEMDNLKLKIEIREEARKHGIPVVMVTGDDSGLIIDIERFDRDSELPLLNGLLSDEVIDGVRKLKEGRGHVEERVLLARDFIGGKYLSERLMESFDLVGKTLAGIPQLSESSFLRGAAVCYFVRKIVTGGEAPSGRYLFQLNSLVRK